MALADSRMVDVTSHFMPKWRYIGAVSWMFQMRQEVRQVKGRGNYIIRSDRENLTNAGVKDERLHT